MKIGELFVELGIKTDDASLGKLAKFEDALLNVAQAASMAVAELKQLAAIHLPREMRVVVKTESAGGAGGSVAGGGGKKGAKAPVWSNRPWQPGFQGATPAFGWNPMAPVTPGTSSFQGPLVPAGGLPKPSRMLPGMTGFIGPVQPAATTQVPPMLNLGTTQQRGMLEFTKFLRQIAGVGSLALIFKNLISGLTQMVKASMQASFGLDRFTRQTGMTLEETKKWEQIAAARGVPFEEFSGTLAMLRQNAEKISMGLNGNTKMMQWGIDPLSASRNPALVFEAFQKATQYMSESAALAVAAQADIPAKVAQALLRERESPTAIVKGTQLTQAQLEANRNLASSWELLKVAATSLADKMTAEVAPAFTRVLKVVTELVNIANISPTFRNVAQASPLTALGAYGAAKMMGTEPRLSVKVYSNPNMVINGISDPEEAAKLFRASHAEHLERALSDALSSRPNPYGTLQPTP